MFMINATRLKFPDFPKEITNFWSGRNVLQFVMNSLWMETNFEKHFDDIKVDQEKEIHQSFLLNQTKS